MQQKTYVLSCGQCGRKSMKDLKRRQKTVKQCCLTCGSETRKRVVGIVNHVYKKRCALRIHYYKND